MSGSERIKHPAPGVRKAGSEINWLQRDHLSSVRLMTNASGAIISENHFRPYGARTDAQLAAGVPRESKGWIGERDDPETGLTFLNARYYDPVLARFISPDWFDPQEFGVGTNRYAYGMNNPIAMKDPSGNVAFLAAVPSLAGKVAAVVAGACSGGCPSALAGIAAAIGITSTYNALSNEEAPIGKISGAVEGLDEALGPWVDVTDKGAKEQNIDRDKEYEEALKDITDVLGGKVVGAFDTPWGGGVEIELPDGTKISARPGSSNKRGRPTIEVLGSVDKVA